MLTVPALPQSTRSLPHASFPRCRAALQQGQPHAVPQPQQSWSRRITGMEEIPPQPGPPSGLLQHQDLAPSSTRCTARHQHQDGALGRGTPTPAAVAGQSLGGDVPRVLPLSTASTSQPWHTGPGTRLMQCQHPAPATYPVPSGTSQLLLLWHFWKQGEWPSLPGPLLPWG